MYETTSCRPSTELNVIAMVPVHSTWQYSRRLIIVRQLTSSGLRAVGQIPPHSLQAMIFDDLPWFVQTGNAFICNIFSPGSSPTTIQRNLGGAHLKVKGEWMEANVNWRSRIIPTGPRAYLWEPTRTTYLVPGAYTAKDICYFNHCLVIWNTINGHGFMYSYYNINRSLILSCSSKGISSFTWQKNGVECLPVEGLWNGQWDVQLVAPLDSFIPSFQISKNRHWR